MKVFIAVMFMAVALVGGCYKKANAAQILGLDLKFSEGLELQDAIGFARNNNTGDNPEARGMVAGLYTGSIAGFHTATGYKTLGLGGFAFYASSSVEPGGGVNWIPTFTPVSFWNDSIHFDVGKNLQDKSYTLGIGVSGTADLLTKFGTTLTGMVR